MKNAIIIFLLLTSTQITKAFDATLKFIVTPSQAKIYVNGELKGTGEAVVKLERAIYVEVKITCEGYLTYYKNYRYGKGSQFAKNTGVGGYERGKNEYTIALEVDPNYVSPEELEEKLDKISTESDSINKFITVNVNKKYSQSDAWKMANQVISDYFDDIESNDVESGTIKTTWNGQVFQTQKIRTRIIVKDNKDGTFKIKIQSEISNDQNASVKEDEKFQEWDRVLKKYKNSISDLKTKLQ